jgi:3',5'-cyclic AMP phosphodiesterase CpdA
MFRLAHVTDPHFRAWAGLRLGAFLNKRAIGTLNLLLNRRRVHRMEMLVDMQRDLRGRAVDHLVITGDLSNVSLESEWQAARSWIEGLGTDPAHVTVIPGNHDAYVHQVVRDGVFERIFAPYQSAELRRDAEVYPFARVREGVAIIGVNSCVATGDLGAWGVIGEPQRRRLEDLLADPHLRGKTRVLLIHHPPVVNKQGEHRNLRDRDALAALLSRTGADLVLHGHDHMDCRWELKGPDGRLIPIIGAGSASYAGAGDRSARYNVYEIEGRAITAVTYAFQADRGGFHEVKRQPIST